MREHRGGEKPGFADPDHRARRERTRRIEPGVVEACDDMRVGALRFALLDAREQAGHREGIVIGPLDRGRPERGLDRADDGIRPRGLRGGCRDHLGHRGGRVRIDDVQSHGFHLPLAL